MSVVVVLVSFMVGGSVEAQSVVDRGKYLVEVLAACGNCHTPKGAAGDVPGKHMAGGFEIKESFGTAIAPNITPDRETGIGSSGSARAIPIRGASYFVRGDAATASVSGSVVFALRARTTSG
jgi:hypothetical protein